MSTVRRGYGGSARRGLAAVCVLLGTVAFGDEPRAIPWDVESLGRAPRIDPAPGFEEPGVRSLYFEGPPYQGRPTRVFAWVGLPEVPPGERAPGIVLVHGGGGTAFAEWVRLWTDRGYAAIALDTCGCTPGGENANRPRHEHGGPPGWNPFAELDRPVTDQWVYHAVADVLLAHSLLRSLPEVDPERTGVTGISWGGYLTCIAAGVDPRFKFAAPVYGCGFLEDGSIMGDAIRLLPEDQRQTWRDLWEPSVYLPRAEMPILWVTGTNDFGFPLDSLRRSYRLPTGPRTLAIRIRMPHGHGGPGENPEEIRAFADSVVEEGVPLATAGKLERHGSAVRATFDAKSPIARAELCYTADDGRWQDRLWESAPARLEGRHAVADLPANATTYFLNLIDERGLIVSTEHAEASEDEGAPAGGAPERPAP